MEPEVLPRFSSSPPPLEDGVEEEEDDFGDFGAFSGVPSSASFSEFATPTTFNQTAALSASSPPALLGRAPPGATEASKANGEPPKANGEPPKANGVLPGRTERAPLTNEPLTNEPLTNEPLTNEPLTKEMLTNETLTNEPLTNGFLGSGPPSQEATPPEDDFADFAAFSGGQTASDGAGRDQRGHAPQEQGHAPQEQGHAPQEQGHAPQEQGHAPQEQGHAPQEQGHAPQEQGHAPQEQGHAPQERGHAPQERGHAPQEQGHAPQEQGKQGHAPQEPGHAPQEQGHAPQEQGEQGHAPDGAAGDSRTGSPCPRGSSPLRDGALNGGEALAGVGGELSPDDKGSETETSLGRPLSADALEEFADASTPGSAPLGGGAASPDEDGNDFADFGDATGGETGFADFEQLDVQRPPSPMDANQDSARQDGGEQDGARQDGGKKDGARQDGVRRDGSEQDGARQDGVRHDGGELDGARQDGGEQDGGEQDGVRHDGARHDGGEQDGGKPDGARHDGGEQDGARHDGGEQDGGEPDGARHDGGEQDGARHDGGEQDGARHDGGEQDGARHDGGEQDGARHVGGEQDGARQDGGEQDGARHDGGEQDGAQRDDGSELEDDFGDFNSPRFQSGGAEDGAGFPGSDSFGNFSCAQSGELENGEQNGGGEQSGEQDDGGGWNAFGETPGAEEEESWAEFTEPSGRERREEEAVTAETSSMDQQTVSLAGRLEKLFQISFPPSAPRDQPEERVASLQILLEPPQNQPEGGGPCRRARGGVWAQLQDIHEALGLRYQWGGSHCNKALLCCLGIDTRNILFTGQKKQPVIVPMYAAGLGMLEPTKQPAPPVSAAELIASIAHQPPAPPPGSPPDPVQQEALPPVQFDWSSSGLTNPLDASGGSSLLNLDFFGPVEDLVSSSSPSIPGVDPELYELTTVQLDPSSSSRVADAFARLMSTMETTSTRRSRREEPQGAEPLSEEASAVIGSLPDLSFMQAKVLMFPSTLTAR